MNKLLITILSAVTFMACSEPGSSNHQHKNAEYSIIFNQPDTILGESVALGIIGMDGAIRLIGEGLVSPVTFSISKDGSIVVYNSTTSQNPSETAITVSYIDDLKDTLFTNMKSAINPKISPDGKYIAYRQNQYEGLPIDSVGIYVMTVRGTQIKYLVENIKSNPLGNFGWTSDSKGINYEVYSEGSYFAYYIDKDGLNDPVEIENPFKIYGPEDLEYYSLEGFERAGLPADLEADSMGFYPYNFNEQKNKVWKLLIISIANPNPPPRFILISYFLGYDFDKKTEKFLSSGLVISTSSVSWSPNNVDIALFTTTGLEIVRVDGTSSKILEYNLDTATMSRLYHSWILRRD